MPIRAEHSAYIDSRVYRYNGATAHSHVRLQPERYMLTFKAASSAQGSGLECLHLIRTPLLTTLPSLSNGSAHYARRPSPPTCRKEKQGLACMPRPGMFPVSSLATVQAAFKSTRFKASLNNLVYPELINTNIISNVAPPRAQSPPREAIRPRVRPLRSRNPLFLGRAAERKEIKQVFSTTATAERNITPKPCILIIQGLGGTGKSELCLEYLEACDEM